MKTYIIEVSGRLEIEVEDDDFVEENLILPYIKKNLKIEDLVIERYFRLY